MTEEQIKELSIEVTDAYTALLLDEDFNSESINENVFLGISYANLVNLNVALPTEEGLILIKEAKEFLDDASDPVDSEDFEDDEDWNSEDE